VGPCQRKKGTEGLEDRTDRDDDEHRQDSERPEAA
jgi:hypothetical protein